MKYAPLVLILAASAAPMCGAQTVSNAPQGVLASAAGTSAGAAGNGLPARGDSLALLQFLARTAIEHSPQIREASAATRAAHMDTEETKGARWPKLDVTANSRAANFGGSSAVSDGSTGRLGLTATYNLYDAGRTSSLIKSREFSELSASAKIALARESVAFDTVSAYLEMIRQQKTVALYVEHIARLTALVSKLEQVVQAFAGRRSELTQANARLGQARDGMDSALARQRSVRLSLARLLGSDALIPPREQKVPQFDLWSPAQSMPAALAHHPQLQSALADTASLKASVLTAAANRRPQVDLEASKLSGRDINGNVTPGQIYLAVRWNAFQGFSGQATERAAVERVTAADERYQQAKIDIEYKINNAWADYQTSSIRLKAMRSLALETDQVRKDYYVQWNDLARRSLLEVLTAENDHLSTLLNLTNSEIDEQIALAKGRFESGTLADWMVGAAVAD